MRKILSLVLALSMVLGMFSFAFAAQLSDIEGEYYEAAVEALVELGVVNGYGDNTFKPNNEVTRAEMAKMLVIALGQKQAAEIAKGSTQFSDVAADHWAAGYINVAAQYKVIVGYPDGTFDPEAKVTYAEAVTMALRALGYKNVVEAAGTWPTNYITKANELQLLDGMKYNGADDGAKRGNVAILLWNMLRTEMWAIQSENQTNGMTYGKTTDEPMLNIKFPDYRYEDEAEFVAYSVDETKVEVTVDVDGERVTGELKKGDLLRLVPEMEVAFLYNIEDEEFLTLTCVDTLVEGRVDKNGKLNGKEYTGIDDTMANKYVVAIVEGKKVVGDIIVLPDGGTEIDGDNKTLKAAQKEIDEDTLVLIDGEWGNGTDLKEGDVYTKIVAGDLHANFAGTFYVVARNRVEGTFESITREADKEESRGFIEVDDEEYDYLADPHIYEYDEKKEEYKDVDFDKVYAKKDNKYLEEDVELAVNYLGEVINMYFGQIKGEDNNDIKYFVLTGNYPWFTSSEDGKEYFMKMTDTDGDEEKTLLESVLGRNLEIEFPNGIYKEMTEVYVNGAGGKDVDGYLIDKEAGEVALRAALLDLVRFYNLNKDGELEEADPAEYAKVYAESMVYANPDELLDDDNYLDNGKKVTKSTKVIKITPVLDDDKVVDIEVEVLEGPSALKGVEEGRCVVEVDDDGNEKVRATYVFVAEDAKSSELQFGVIEKVGQYKGEPSATISGTRYKLEVALDENTDVGALVSFKVSDDGVATIRDEVFVTDLADDTVILATDVDDELVTVDNYADPVIDTEAESTIDKYEKYQFVLVKGSFDKDDKVELDSDADVLGEGIEGVSFKKGDRIVEGAAEKVVFVIRLSDINIDKEMIDNTGVKVDRP